MVYCVVGAGPRKKNLYVVEVNVYAVGLYADTADVHKVLGGSLKGKTADDLSKEASYYKGLLSPKVSKVGENDIITSTLIVFPPILT